ncbi:gas vesicle protein [Nesterenkonia sp. Act20]|uniref:gas vesicle protein n=1 Tax=Nesterenkonia sp. Act20 TaxID=1483432 RepID=UPI001C496236|nr:gas vesicle protein [Nesterenkonia sp. Act20]
MSHPPQPPRTSHLTQGAGLAKDLAERPAALQPTRDPGATLPDLLEVLLNKGVHLNLDLIISVADIPLIGVNLRATIAGIETMLEYGMMRQWDEQTRAWVQKSLTKHLPMADGEEIVSAMAASYLHDDFYQAWRPGRAYLTNRRLILHRRDPAETLWQSTLADISGVEPVQETSVGGETRTRLKLKMRDGSEEMISAADPQALLKLLRTELNSEGQSLGGGANGSAGPAQQQVGPLFSGSLWVLETLAQGSTWRGGRGTLEEAGDFTWKSPMDSRPLLRCGPSEIVTVERETLNNPTDHDEVLRVETSRATYRLASPELSKWQQHLTEWAHATKEAPHGAAG